MAEQNITIEPCKIIFKQLSEPYPIDKVESYQAFISNNYFRTITSAKCKSNLDVTYHKDGFDYDGRWISFVNNSDSLRIQCFNIRYNKEEEQFQNLDERPFIIDIPSQQVYILLHNIPHSMSLFFPELVLYGNIDKTRPRQDQLGRMYVNDVSCFK